MTNKKIKGKQGRDKHLSKNLKLVIKDREQKQNFQQSEDKDGKVVVVDFWIIKIVIRD